MLLKLFEQVLTELAVEVDLHYMDQDVDGLQETIGLLREGCAELVAQQRQVPEAVAHVLHRFALYDLRAA